MSGEMCLDIVCIRTELGPMSSAHHGSQHGTSSVSTGPCAVSLGQVLFIPALCGL